MFIFVVNGVYWNQIHPQAKLDHLGFIPMFFDALDPRPAREQIDENYISGWRHQPGFTVKPKALSYSGDPDLPELFWAKLHDECITVYAHGYVSIAGPEGLEICRVD